jgi:hypothetical protein
MVRGDMGSGRKCKEAEGPKIRAGRPSLRFPHPKKPRHSQRRKDASRLIGKEHKRARMFRATVSAHAVFTINMASHGSAA